MKAGKVAASNNTARPPVKRNNKRQFVEGGTIIILFVRGRTLARGEASSYRGETSAYCVRTQRPATR